MNTAPHLPDEATWRTWGIDPSWSRTVDVAGHDGRTHRWHVLDTGGAPPSDRRSATIVCVHGNPTWGYAWKSFLTRFAGTHRVVAVDQLGMGYSERGAARRYAQRVQDLDDVIAALDLDASSPLILAAHDWGGAVAMGWAVDHADSVAGMVLCNTGIAVPEGRSAPGVIRLAASAPLRDLVCRRTSTFVNGTLRLSGDRITALDRAAFRAPYGRAEHRSAIADFVGDVPLRQAHPSEHDLHRVAGLLNNVEAPVLLAWGANDIVFDDDFALDLAGRFPKASLQRFAHANHLVMAETDVAGAVDTWLSDVLDPSSPLPRPVVDATDSGETSVFDGIERRRDDPTVAVRDLAAGGPGGDSIDFATFARRVDGVAAELIGRGLAPGDRVAMLTPPGIDLLVAVYGVWRAGGVTVVADRGLGLRGLGAAVSSTRPEWTIGPRTARVASRLLRWAPHAVHVDIADLIDAADRPSASLPPPPSGDAKAAVLFTSGATGPAKGVRYLHRQLAGQRDALAATYSITDDDRLVAAFAPFALYGPSLGVPTALADCDVTTPGRLTADALDAACRSIDATMTFASPAALANVVATGRDRTPWNGLACLRLVFSAGAPVPVETLGSVAAMAPNASLHTPYGMTEALPVADIDLDGIDAAGAGTSGDGGGGVCVGAAVRDAELLIAPLGFDPLDGVPAGVASGETGEILVRAPWVSEGYLGRWEVERQARPGAGWHRTGDVGHLDDHGRLWVEGRSVHVVDAADGPSTPVPVERAVERALVPGGLARAGRVAAVGVGPAGCQQLVIVLEQADAPPGLADAPTAEAVRAAVDRAVAAVLVTDDMPVDIRHNAKIDRTAVGEWAAHVLAGGPPSRRPLVRLRRLVAR